MIGYEFNDGGRAAAGYKGSAGDCVARAFAILTGMDYKTAYKLFAEANSEVTGKVSARNGIKRTVWPQVFEDYGIVKMKLRRGVRPTYSEAYAMFGDCIVKTTKHVAAIKDGKLQDTGDGRTYEWQEFPEDEVVTRERKAMSVYKKLFIPVDQRG